MNTMNAAPKEKRKTKSRNGKKEAVKATEDGMKEAVEATDKEKSNPIGSMDVRRKGDQRTSKSKAPNMEKASLKPLTVKLVPRGCLDSLKMVEERVVLDDINVQSKGAEEVMDERNDEDTYIVTLLKGLDTITDIAVAPLEEILSDARLDPDKKKYVERVENSSSANLETSWT
jgi:hypothetical protein